MYFQKESIGLSHWIGDLAIDPFNPDKVLHISGVGIWDCENLTASDRGQPTHWNFPNEGLEETFYSRNLGKTWLSVRGLPKPERRGIIIPVADRVKPGIIYACANNRFYRSENGGESFDDTGCEMETSGRWGERFGTVPGFSGHL